MSLYRVKQGDCLSSIAIQHGWLPASLWNLPENSSLKDARKSPNALCPGDRLFIANVRPHKETGGTEAKHRFRRKGVPVKLKLRLQRGVEALADEAVTLEVDGVSQELTTDGQGYLEVPIPPAATKASLSLASMGKKMTLNLGHLNADNDVAGGQARLNNLGFDVGAEDGAAGEKTRRAVTRFQRSQSLQETGELDEATLAKLKDVHGS